MFAGTCTCTYSRRLIHTVCTCTVLVIILLLLILRVLVNLKLIACMWMQEHLEWIGVLRKFTCVLHVQYMYMQFEVTVCVCRVTVLEKGSPNSMCVMESGKVIRNF